MPLRSNPFVPNRPVHSEMFRGRDEEVDRIITALMNTIDGNPNHLLIVGERGIGKTSLLFLASALAKGDIKIGKECCNYLTIYISLEKNMKLLDFSKILLRKIDKELRDMKSINQKIKDIWSFIQKFEIAGTKYNKNDKSNYSEIVEELSSSISKTVESIRGKRDGIVLLIDEIDSISDELNMGTILKKLTEQLVLDQTNQVQLILSGLPRARRKLEKGNPSSLRIFEEIELKPISVKASEEIILRGLELANEKLSKNITITPKALHNISFYSEGYPHFIQQFSFCAYKCDTDYNIDVDDVDSGANEALVLIGNRYYSNLFYNKIKKDSYRTVLYIMANSLNNWITKAEIRKEFSGKSSTLDNAIKTLCEKNIILRNPRTRGQYKLQWMGFALWINYKSGFDKSKKK